MLDRENGVGNGCRGCGGAARDRRREGARPGLPVRWEDESGGSFPKKKPTKKTVGLENEILFSVDEVFYLFNVKTSNVET